LPRIFSAALTMLMFGFAAQRAPNFLARIGVAFD
jgi:hypothetical protein